MTWLADQGYDPVFGARPLKRVIQRALQDPLAEMLSGRGAGQTIHVSAGEDGLLVGGHVGRAGHNWARWARARKRRRCTKL